MQFHYRAVGLDGVAVEGVRSGADMSAVAAALRLEGLFALAISPAERGLRIRPASRRELAIIFRSLASLSQAGVPLEKAIAATVPVASERLAPELERWRTLIHEGSALSTALASQPGLIPPVVLGVLRAGERGSALDAALAQVAEQLEQEAELRARVRQALAYPILVASAGTISVLAITTLVLPKFAGLLSDLGQQLPPATQLLISTSDVVQHHGMTLLTLLVASLASLVAWIRSERGSAWWSAQLLALPLIGRLRLLLASARLGRSLGALLGTGLPMLASLDAAAAAVGDPAIAARLGRVRDAVSGGATLSQALERNQACSSTVLPLFKVGEASGQLGVMASRAGHLAAQEAERRLAALVNLLEPALIILFGGMVAFVAAALLQAVYALRPA